MSAKADIGTCHPHTYRVRFATCKVAPSSIFSAPSFVLSAAAFEGLALRLRSRLRERLSPSCRLQRFSVQGKPRARRDPHRTFVACFAAERERERDLDLEAGKQARHSGS